MSEKVLFRHRPVGALTAVAWRLDATLLPQLGDVERTSVILPTSESMLRHALATHRLPCLLFSVPGDRPDPIWEELQRIRKEFPQVPLVAVAIHGKSSFAATLHLGTLGYTHLIPADPLFDMAELRKVLWTAFTDGVVTRIWTQANVTLSDPFQTVLRRALMLAHAPLSAAQLASSCQLHERSLRKYCTRHGLPEPWRIVGWARLLTAAFYFDDPALSLNSISDLLAFSTPSALRKLVARFTDLSIADLRALGAMTVVASRLQREQLTAQPEAAWPPLRLVQGAGGGKGQR